MSRVLFAAAAALIAVLAGLSANWALEHYQQRRPPAEAYHGDPRLKFRSGAFLAREAVRRYHALPPDERRILRRDLLASIGTLDDWSADTAASARLVCLGERHHPAIRSFLARQVLPRLDYRALMLETGADGLARIRQSLFLDGKAMLLGAPINAVLEATGRSGIAPRLLAIDETARQVKARTGGTTTNTAPGREETLTRNVLAGWAPHGQHVVLMGALHCRDVPGWLFHRVAAASPAMHEQMLAVVVMAREQESGARLLFYLLDEMAIEPAVLVIPDVSRFPRQVQAWLPPVADALAGYRSAILFDAQRL